MAETKPMIPPEVDPLPQLPPDTEPLEHQVAGHFYGRSKTKFGLLQRRSTGEVLKPLLNPPRGPREHRFYLHVFSEEASSELVALRSFLPKLLGTYEFDGMSYLVLENIVQAYQHPCVIDIKLGRITYDQEATQEKIERQIAKFEPAAEIGFQLLGWKTYRPSIQSYIYHDKKCARSLTKEELLYGLAHFFGAPERHYRAIVQAVLDRLIALEQTMSKQFEFVFIASSVLITYDGSARDNEAKVDVRLVDFAHVFPSSNKEPDENFLFGLRHCIKYLTTLLDEQFQYICIEKLEHHAKPSASSCSMTHKAEYPVDYDWEEHQKKPHAACDLLRYDLKMCLLASDCCKLGHTPKECLSDEKLREFVPDECRRLAYTFFECKRSMLDMRARFRGRKGEIY